MKDIALILEVFRHTVTGASLGKKLWGAMGRLEVCRVGAGKIFQIPIGAGRV